MLKMLLTNQVVAADCLATWIWCFQVGTTAHYKQSNRWRWRQSSLVRINLSCNLTRIMTENTSWLKKSAAGPSLRTLHFNMPDINSTMTMQNSDGETMTKFPKRKFSSYFFGNSLISIGKCFQENHAWRSSSELWFLRHRPRRKPSPLVLSPTQLGSGIGPWKWYVGCVLVLT